MTGNQVIVFFDPTKKRVPRSGLESFNGFSVLPGRNLLTSDSVAELLVHPTFIEYKNEGVVTIIESSKTMTIEEQSSNVDIPLSKYSAQDAIRIVSAEVSKDKLIKWQKIEKRSTVLNAIAAQIKSIDSGNL